MYLSVTESLEDDPDDASDSFSLIQTDFSLVPTNPDFGQKLKELYFHSDSSDGTCRIKDVDL